MPKPALESYWGMRLDVFVGITLVRSYLRFEFTEDVHHVFDELAVRDVVLWNAMINGFAQIGQFGRAMEVCRKMGEEGVVLSKFTVTGMLSVFTIMGDLNNGRAIHGFVIIMGHNSGVAVLNALIDMYGKCKRVEGVLKIFEMMHEKDIFSWNSILCVHDQCGDHDGTLRLFDRMLCAGVKPDLVTVTTVLPACARLAVLMHGKEIHSYMIINGLEEGDDEDVDDVYVTNAVMDIMREAQLKPDEITFVGVLSACSHAGLGWAAKEAYELAATTPIEANPVVWRALLAACWFHGNAALAEVAAQQVSEVRHTMRQHNMRKTQGCSWIELSDGVHVFVTGDLTHPEDYLIYAVLNSLNACIYENGYMRIVEHDGS
ncbi:pentatricopeptide repeat (PPR) superfamily protein [Actinidia rufa]|uniref:Pentatricopeptide repeat (PPR) superfamily protein n=1 Tax=Actinidia rufa TaxID=165716 RepID=A0A7J0FXL5_9ERIC|nr:pentatricopeptide repeat (PPR) superfamily protein [Actinidia rufa]